MTTANAPAPAATAICGPLIELRDAFKFVRPAISGEVTRPYLCGVYLDLTSEGVKIRATDGHRLHQVTFGHVQLPTSRKLFPSRIFLNRDDVAKICALKASDCEDEDYVIDFATDLVWAGASYHTDKACKDMLNLDLDRVQPWKVDRVFTFTGRDMLPVLNAAAACRPGCAIRLDAPEAAERLLIEARMSHNGGEVRIRDEILGEAQRAFSVGFNAVYARDAIKAFGRYARIDVSFKDDGGPTLWAEREADTLIERHVVLMPCRV